MLNYWAEGDEDGRGILRKQMQEMRAWGREGDPLTEEDLAAAREAAYTAGSEYVFISLEASGEEKAEVYKNLTSEYDPSWAEWILITEQIANFSWQEPAWSPYVPSVKSVVIWVSPSDDYIRLHPEMVYKALNGNPTAGHYFYCWYADEQTAAEGIAAQQPGWHAKPVYAFAPDFLEGDEYPHNRRLGQ